MAYTKDIKFAVKKTPKIPDWVPDLGVLTGWWQFGLETERKKRWDMFVVDQFLKGNHSIKANPVDNSITLSKTNAADQINFPINMIWANFRSVRAYVTRHNPVVNVEPYNFSQEAIDYSKQANKILERDNKLNNYEEINKDWVYYGIKYGVGYRQIGWDATSRKAIRWTIDPFHLVIVQPYGRMEDAPAIIKAFRRPVDYMRHKYPDFADSFSADDELSPDPYQQVSLQLEYQQASNHADTDKAMVTAYEVWYRVLKPNSMQGTINKCVYTSSGVCDWVETPYTEYPFIPYYSDQVPNSASGDGHLKHIIPAQRMLNLLNTQLLEYNHIVNRGRFLLDKNSGFRVINTKEGQLIFRNPGKRVESLPPPQINPLLERQLNMAMEFIDTIGGQHAASRGASPERVYSGNAIEQLQMGDSNNILDLRTNFEIALAKEAAWVLKMYSLFENQGQVINMQDGEQDKSFVAVGQKAYSYMGQTAPDTLYMDDQNYNVMQILDDHQVSVSIKSKLGETEQDKINMMMKLVELGVIPGKALLKHLEFPNIADLHSQLADEVASEIVTENMKGQQGQQQQQGLESLLAESGGSQPAPGAPMPQEMDATNQQTLGELDQLLGGMGGQNA